MRFCTRQDNDVTLSQFGVIHNIDVDTIIAIQGCELLGFQAIRVRHRDSRATQRDELCNDTSSGDATTDDSYSSGTHWWPKGNNYLFADRWIDLTPSATASGDLGLPLHPQDGRGDTGNAQHHEHTADEIHRTNLRGANKNRTCDLILIRDAL